MYNIFPNLKKQQLSEEYLNLDKVGVYFSKKMANVAKELQTFLLFDEVKENANLEYLVKKNLAKEAYEIDIQ